MSALLGARLGPYEILAPVGAGGMGEVYRARDTRLGREVAIKVLPPQLLDSPEALARFEREARAVAALNHPNILALHDIGREGPVSYAVTELLEGETVRARIASGPMPPRRALEILTQVARGLGAAHERGIVHRDIKPENLFLTHDGRVKILDFGVAVRAGDPVDTAEVTRAALTEPGMLVGTPAYMAPEQLLAQNATPRSDVFAFGLVAYELLTGKHPFSRATFGETTIAVLREEPTPLNPAIAASLPPGVAPLLSRCLEKQPGDRPGSARDLALYLETLSSAPVAIAGSHAVSDDAESIVRRRVLLGSIVLLLITVLLTWGYAGLMADRAVTGAIENDLARADRLVHRVQGDRFTRLALTAQLLASFPGLNALFAGTDPSTINDFLLSYQASHPGTPTLIALTKDGQLLARTDRPAAESDATIQKLPGVSGASAIVLLDGRPHHVAVEAASAGDTPFGYIVAALPIDSDFAQSLREATQDEIVLLSSSIIVSTLRGSQAPWKSIQDWRQQGGRRDRSLGVNIGGQRVVAREVSLSTEPIVSAIVAKSRDEVAAPFRRIQSGLIAIGALCAALAVAGAFWMARNVTRAILPSARHRR